MMIDKTRGEIAHHELIRKFLMIKTALHYHNATMVMLMGIDSSAVFPLTIRSLKKVY